MVTTLLQCDCGFEASAEDEDGLVVEIQRHARDEHGMALSLREALRLASHATSVVGSSRDSHRRVGNRQKEEQ
jgi:predicted small metal-binding protein